MKKEIQKTNFLESYLVGEVLIGGGGFASKVLAGGSALIIIASLDIFRYGTYILIISFFTLLNGFISRTLHGVVLNDIIRYTSKGEAPRAKKLFWEITGMRLLLTLVLFSAVFGGASVVADFYDEDIANLVRLTSLVLFGSFVKTTLTTLFRSQKYFKFLALWKVVENAFKLFTLILFAAFSVVTLPVVLFLYAVSSLAAGLLFLPVFLSRTTLWRDVRASRASELIPIVRTYGKWQLFGDAFGQSMGSIRPWLIKFFVNTEAVAVYSVAESLFGFVKGLMPTTTLPMLVPREIHDKARSERIFVRGVKYLFIGSTVLALVGALVVPPAVFTFIPQYGISVPFFLALLIVIPIITVWGYAKTFLIALRKQKYLFYTGVAYTVVGLLSAALLLYIFGLWGMVYQRVFITVFMAVLIFGYVWRHLVSPSSRKMLFRFDEDDRNFIAAFTRTAYERARNAFSRSGIIR